MCNGARRLTFIGTWYGGNKELYHEAMEAGEVKEVTKANGEVWAYSAAERQVLWTAFGSLLLVL